MKKDDNKELFKGPRGIAVKLLNRIDRTDAYLEKLLDNEIKNSELSPADKALLYEITHGVIRWQNRLDWILNGFYFGNFTKSMANFKNALRVALYQLLFLDKIPDYAAVNEAVEFVKKFYGQKQANITNGILRAIIRNKNSIRYPNPEDDLVGYLSVYYSHPNWMVKRYLERFGKEETEKLLIANNKRPRLTLVPTRFKITPEEFEFKLKEVNLQFERGSFLTEYFHLKTMTNITDWELYSKGYFFIQDESAGMACKALNLSENLNVLDMCAAPGGKTSYISCLMKNSGRILALEKFESRANILKKNLERIGALNVDVIVADAMEFSTDEKFDKVLLDAPCTGTGVLTKKPDIKWKKDIFDIRKMSQTQYEMLQKASEFVKKDGILVYSVCSIEIEEGKEIIKKFLNSNDKFILSSCEDIFPKEVLDEDGCITTYPHKHKIDGSFAARLIKIKD